MDEKKSRVIKRNRDCEFCFRTTSEERDEIVSEVKRSGLSLPDFVLKLVRGGNVVIIDGADDILLELKREGNNLNQAVRNFYVGEAFAEEILEAERRCVALYEKISEKLEGA